MTKRAGVLNSGVFRWFKTIFHLKKITKRGFSSPPYLWAVANLFNDYNLNEKNYGISTGAMGKHKG